MEKGTKATLGLLARVVLGVGLILTGWGWDDWRGFFAHPARVGLLAVVLLGVVPVLAGWVEMKVFRKGKKPVGKQRWLLAGVMVLMLGLIWFLPYGDRRGLLSFAGSETMRYSGLALYTVGNALALVALRALGKQYSGYVTLQDDHQLVQAGIYGVIRHPIYLRGLLMAVGLPLIFRSQLVFPFLAFIVVFVAARIRQEEKLLAEQFGAEFDAYRRRTWRLLPFVY